MKAPTLTRISLGLAMTFALGTAFAQAGKGPTQVVKPPVSQAWIDVATFAGMGMPAKVATSIQACDTGGLTTWVGPFPACANVVPSAKVIARPRAMRDSEGAFM